MTARFAAVFILLSAQIAWGQETQNNKTATDSVVVTYPVAELVVPINGLDTESSDERTEKTKERWLIDKITRTVSPGTWSENGGTGTIQYYPLGMALVVKQSPQVHAQLQKLLVTLRSAQSIEVSMETRVLTVSSSFYRGLTSTAEKDLNLSRIQLFMLLEAAQGDTRADAFQAPKITLCPGQRGRVAVDGKIDAKLCAMVASNLQHIDVDVKASVGGVKFEKNCRVVDGSTLVLASPIDATRHQLLLVTPCIIIDEEEAVVPPPPPTVKNSVQSGATVIQAVARDVAPLAAPIPFPPTKVKENPRLATILQKYDAACAAGDQAKARKLAVRALDIDPACFQKK